MSTWRTLIRDGSRAVVGERTDWTSLTVVEKFNDVSTWSITYPGLTDPVPANGGLLIYRNGQLLVSGPPVSTATLQNATYPGGLVTVSGVSDDTVLAERVCYPDPTHASSTQTAAAADSRTGVAETIVRQYVDLNAGPSAITARQVSGLTLAPNGTQGATNSGAPNMGFRLSELITALLLPAGLGWRVVPNGSGLQFQVYVPRDLTGLVRFGWDLGNVDSLEYTVYLPTATREIVGSSGTGTSKTYTEVADTGLETLIGRRIENYVDGASTVSGVLAQAGAAQLAADAGGTQLNVTVIDTEAQAYGTAYGLGDKVTVLTPAGEVSEIVREVALTVTQSTTTTETVQPTIGDPSATRAPATTKQLRQILGRLTKLEART